MEGPERIVCCTLCLCMAVAVFSSVALVYLTALVYMPSKREINSGLTDVPVVCTTVERLLTDDCDWYSCGEWCLSKSSHCVKLWAEVRKNGSDVVFEGCTDVEDITCMVLDGDFIAKTVCGGDHDCRSANERFMSKCGPYDCGEKPGPFRCDSKAGRCTSIRQHRNCKMDNKCTDLEHLFLCEDGLCENITSVFDCAYDKVQTPLDCTDKRNCITLDGLYDCKKGQCSKLEWPWHCERRCPPVSTSREKNVVLLSGDRMISARCDMAAAIDIARDPETIWTDYTTDGEQVLMASCTELSSSYGELVGRDCVNGTLMPRRLLPRTAANYTLIHRIFQDFGHRFPLDRAGTHVPYDTNLIIYNRTKLLINTEACVNTLQYECTQFYLDHRRDGRNYSARDRYPCYYTPRHGDFVTTRFSVEDTRYVFLMAFAIPASLWVLSCSCLFGCSKVLRVEENGQMRVRCRKPLSSMEDPEEIVFRRAASSRKSFRKKKSNMAKNA